MVSQCGTEIYRFGSLLLGDMYEVLFGWFNQCREMEKIIDFSNKKSKNMIQCLLNIKQIRGIEYGKKYRFKLDFRLPFLYSQ